MARNGSKILSIKETRKVMANDKSKELIKALKSDIASARREVAADKKTVAAAQKAFIGEPSKESGKEYRTAVSEFIKSVMALNRLISKLEAKIAAEAEAA